MSHRLRQAFLFLLAAAAAFATGGTSASAAPGDVRIIAVGANRSFDPAMAPLHYAESDAREFEQVMRSVGMVTPGNSTLLLAPTLARLRATLRELAQSPAALARQKLIFYFSGHSDELGLHLADGLLPKAELHEALTRIGARTKIAILDSCFSGAISAKGIEPTTSFELPAMEFDEPSGSVFLTASSWKQLAFESRRLQGSVFTHYLIAGLYGAADANGDGIVTIDEIYQYVYRNSRMLSLVSPAATRQEPAMVSSLRGRGAVALSYPARTSGSVVLGAKLSGEVEIMSTAGLQFYKTEKPGGEEKTLRLPAGEFLVVDREAGGRLGEARIVVTPEARLRLAATDFHWADGASGEAGGAKGLAAANEPGAAAGISSELEAPRLEAARRWVLGAGLATGYATGAAPGPAVSLAFVLPSRAPGWSYGGLCDGQRNTTSDQSQTTSSEGCYGLLVHDAPLRLGGLAARGGLSLGLGQTRHDSDHGVTAWAPGARLAADARFGAYGLGLAVHVLSFSHKDQPERPTRTALGLQLERWL